MLLAGLLLLLPGHRQALGTRRQRLQEGGGGGGRCYLACSSSLAAAEALATELAHELSVEREFMVIRDGASRPTDLTTLSSKDAVAQVRNRLDRTPVLSSPVAKADRTHSGFSR